MEGNYPNPFNPSTTIAFQLSTASKVTLKVYNVMGQEVVSVIDNHAMSAGRHEINFNAGDLASGIYFYRLSADQNVAVGKMLLMK